MLWLSGNILIIRKRLVNLHNKYVRYNEQGIGHHLWFPKQDVSLVGGHLCFIELDITEKCEFLRKKVVLFLGHLSTREGVKPKGFKVESFIKFPQHKNQNDIKYFLGLGTIDCYI